MYYIRYPLSFRQVEDILHERGVDICHETVRFWVERFGSKFAGEIRKNRAGHHSNWQWHLECFVAKRRNKAAAKKFLIKTMRKHGSPKIITTDKLASYGVVFREIGIADKQLCGGRSNNRCENSHLPFRRRERAMQKFKSCAMLQKFTSYHAQIYNHFNHERHLQNRQTYKQKRSAALIEWFQICAS